MKNTALIFLLILDALLICENNNAAKLTPATGSVIAVTPHYVDTLKYDGKVIYLEQIDSNEFYNLPGAGFNWLDSIFNHAYVIDDKQNVHFRDTVVTGEFAYGKIETDTAAKVLTLRFQNGTSKQLFCTAMLEPVGYAYIKLEKKLNSYLVGHYYEQYSDYSLFNRATGKESFMCGYPYLSPDTKTLCCYQNPCDGGSPGDFCSSEFLLYTTDADSINLQWETPVKWQPIEGIWKDNQTLYLVIRDGWMVEGNEVRYVKLQLPGIKR